MLLQTLAVALIVAACTLYAAWTLMPVALRRRLATALLTWPLPKALSARLARHAAAASGCGCDGCDQGTKKAVPPAVQTIRFHPRPPH